MGDFRKPTVYEQKIIVPPAIVGIDIRLWSLPGGRRTQRSIKVWEPINDELLAMIVHPEMIGRGIDDHAEWFADELERLWAIYVDTDPFGS